jgi:hypothetical protein
MEYICDKIIFTQSLKFWTYISKLRLWEEFLSEFFMVYDIDIH